MESAKEGAKERSQQDLKQKSHFCVYVHIVCSYVFVLATGDDCNYTVSPKKWATLIFYFFYDNFSKGEPIFIIFFTVKFKGSTEEDGIKTTTSPQICCHTTLRKVSGQYTALQHS